jgi:hypothetical protein
VERDDGGDADEGKEEEGGGAVHAAPSSNARANAKCPQNATRGPFEPRVAQSITTSPSRSDRSREHLRDYLRDDVAVQSFAMSLSSVESSVL